MIAAEEKSERERFAEEAALYLRIPNASLD